MSESRRTMFRRCSYGYQWGDRCYCFGLPGCVKFTRVLETAGTIIGVTEINGQELLVNTTDNILMATTGVNDVIVLVHQFVKLNQELGLLSFKY